MEKNYITLHADFPAAVAEFHREFEVPIEYTTLRIELLMEENDELARAKDKTEIADAICDIIYVAAGTIVSLREFSHKSEFTLPHNSGLNKDHTYLLIKEYIDELHITEGRAAKIVYCRSIIHQCLLLGHAYDIPVMTNFRNVHSNNMAKKWSDDQVHALPADCTYSLKSTATGWIVKSPAGKVLKPPGHPKPDLLTTTNMDKPV